jgi:hypothetical protein
MSILITFRPHEKMDRMAKLLFVLKSQPRKKITTTGSKVKKNQRRRITTTLCGGEQQ